MKNWLGITIALIFAISGILLLQNNRQAVTDTRSNSNKVTPNLATTTVASSYEKEVLKNALAQDTPEQNKISKELKDYLSHEALQESLGEYFDNHSTLSDDSRSVQADELYSQIIDLERRDEIIPIEAFSLKLALLKTTTSETDYPEVAKNLTEEYQDKISSEKPEIDYDKNKQYKQQEREVLLEVQAMSQYPDGMSQSEYLRHRLQILRGEIFEGD